MRVKSGGLIACWLLLTMATSSTAPAQQPPASAPTAPPPPSAKLGSQLAKKLPDSQFNDTGIAELLDYFRDVGGVNIHVDWRSLRAFGVNEGTPVSIQVRDTSLRGALETVLAAAAPAEKVTYLASGDIVWIVSSESAPTRAARISDWASRKVGGPAVAALLEKRLPELKVDRVPASDVIDALRDITGANISVDWKGLEPLGVNRRVPVSARVRDVTLRDVLLVLVESLPSSRPLQLGEDQGAIRIGAPDGPR